MSASDSRILVVDDEPGIAQLCQRVLERAGFDVRALTNPTEAVDILQDQLFDLLLLDIRMPEMDGFQLMSIAKRQQPDLAVVIMTGFGTVETAIQALRQGADGLILKPFEDTTELLGSVNEALKVSQSKREIARLAALRPLFTITEALFSETDPERLLELILNALCGHLRCDHSGLYRKDSDSDLLRLVSKIGEPPLEETSSPDGGPIGRADALGASQVVNSDGPGDEQLQAALSDYGLGSVLSAPVVRSIEPGVILAARAAGEPNFTDADIEMFGILVRQASVALENARLYAELRAYVRQVEDSQQALIQTEKMAAVGRLTASIAHEINNPLQALRNCLHLAVHEELGLEQRNDYLDLAQSELNRLMGTVQRMLDFYRPAPQSRELMDVNEILQRVLKLLQKQLDEQDIEVHASLSAELPKIRVVTNQIQQVFFNIILNAMDAMPDGGDLDVATQAENGHVDIYFQDTGPGVPEEVAEEIFEPFMSTRKQGTGLGLSVSYNIVDAHGGSLGLLPERPGGACFRVRLPTFPAPPND